ncbi:hypothetical protein T492DRAFT_1062727 [Pavlovales sp. CCMP2436]|nr:hypothetical protein T492DRAFT_1062727 [Pavlovales sp. CCMP2436]
MVLYEIVITFDAAAPGARLLTFLKRASNQVLSRSGNLRRVDNWGERPLATRIRKSQQSHFSARFISLWIDAHPNVLKEVEAIVRFDRDVLRFTSFKRKFALPAGNGFIATELREAALRAEEAAAIAQVPL